MCKLKKEENSFLNSKALSSETTNYKEDVENNMLYPILASCSSIPESKPL